MTPSHRTLLSLALALAAYTGLADAADSPRRKSGLWEITTSAAGTPAVTMQMCIDQKQDDMTAGEDGPENMRKRCSKIDVRRAGNATVIDSVCSFEGTTMTSHTVITGNLGTEYKMESKTRFEPPMHGMDSTQATMSGRWLGPCKPGQKHGSMVMTGMPGAAEYGIDPEMLEQMRKMQERYGR